MAHERGKQKGDFCAKPGQPCKHANGSAGANYRDVCKPAWVNHTYEQWVNRKPKPGVVKMGYEAHHILCVSSVSTQIVSGKGIDAIVRGTQWCINKKNNMIALPKWGHTVKWYCKITKSQQEVKGRAKAPLFTGLPQHDWDHNCNNGYTDEITDDLKALAKEIKDSAKSHAAKTKDLAGKLNSKARTWRSKLKTRGLREGGTHKCWSKGKSPGNTSNKWCYPFSMANDKFVQSKSFPVRDFDESVAKWMKRIANAIKKM